MSKIIVAILFLASAAVYDPPRALKLIEPSIQGLGSIVRSVVDIDGLLWRFSPARRR
jgi:hypothetical protein